MAEGCIGWGRIIRSFLVPCHQLYSYLRHKITLLTQGEVLIWRQTSVWYQGLSVSLTSAYREALLNQCSWRQFPNLQKFPYSQVFRCSIHSCFSNRTVLLYIRNTEVPHLQANQATYVVRVVGGWWLVGGDVLVLMTSHTMCLAWFASHTAEMGRWSAVCEHAFCVLKSSMKHLEVNTCSSGGQLKFLKLTGKRNI